MLHEFIGEHRAEILRRCTTGLLASDPPRGEADAVAYLDRVLGVMIGALMKATGGTPLPDVGLPATTGELSRSIGLVCDTIIQLALERHRAAGDPFLAQASYRVIDECAAVALAIHSTLERNSSDIGIRIAELVHELRNALASAVIAFRAIQEGRSSVDGPSAAIVTRCHHRMQDLVGRTLTAARLQTAMPLRRERVTVAGLLREIAATIFPARDVVVAIEPAEPIEIEVDVVLLSSALQNVLQNGVKFTQPGGRVTVRTRMSGDRVVIEVEDRCGGLPPGPIEDLFRPFVQRGTGRGGVGLGLDITKQAVEAHGGKVWARDLPGIGCIFGLDLPCLGDRQTPP